MTTIKEQAAAIKGYAADIDSAIVARGGTTNGGLRHAAAAIAVLPSGVSLLDVCNRTIGGKLDLSGWNVSTNPVRPYHFSYFTNIEEFYGPNTGLTAVYSLSYCTNLKKATVRQLINNVSIITGCDNLVDLTVTNQTAATVLAYPLVLGGLNSACVIHCTDKDVRYIDGAWTAVERI